MKMLLRRWPQFLLTLLLAVLAWALHQFLPIEPRWQIELAEQGHLRTDFYWEAGGRRVRLVETGGSFEEHLRFNNIAPLLGTPLTTPGPLVVEVATGQVPVMFSNLEKKWMQEFKHSPNGRHAAGISRPNQLLWFDFVTGEESRVDLGDVEISHCHFSPRGDFLSVLLEKRPSKVVNVYSAETRELHLSVDVDPNSSPGFLPKSNNHVHTISENGLPFTRIWDLDAKWEIARISGRTSVSLIGPDGKWLITEEAKAKWTRHFFPQSKKTSRGIGYDPKSDVKDMVCVVEMNTHQEVFRLEDEPAWFASLSPKGNTLLVVTSVADEIPLLTCWDIPARRPWPWILGIPFGFFALLLSVRWLLARRIRRKAQVARPATLSG